MNWAVPRLLVRLTSAVFKSRRRESSTLTPDGLRELGRRLRDEKHALEAFTASLEEEFLGLGSWLRKVTALSRDVGNRSSGIVDAAAGRAEDAAVQFAFQLLKKAEDLVRASREQYDTVFRVFEKMHLDLTRVARERSGLMRTLSPLETTNTQFRIQACPFDENTRSQFFALADAIAGIVRDVRLAVGQRFEELDRTGKATGELVTKLTDLATRQRTDTERILAETRAHLSTLDEALKSSERAAQSISDAGANIAGGVARAIVALECQDMARQKFQHICAAIHEMAGHLPSDFVNGFTAAEEADCRHFLADAGRVQLGQLRAVFAQLAGAARQVSAGLGDLESESRSLAGHAVRSGRAALDGRIIQSAIESIRAVLRVIETAVSGITGLVDLVAGLKSTFSDCTTQILGLALRLRTVALNAQIFAAHVDAGASLEVVAGNTRMIADESMRQLDEISSRVNELVAAVADLEQRLVDYAEVAAMERKLLTAEAGESEKKLRALDEDLRASMEAIGPVEAELAAAIQSLIRSIHFPAAVAEAESRSIALFEEIAGLHLNTESDAHQKVQELGRNYTMAHERQVHQTALKMDGPESFETPPLAVEADPPPAGVAEHVAGDFEISPPGGVAEHAQGHFEESPPPPGVAPRAQRRFELSPAPGAAPLAHGHFEISAPAGAAQRAQGHFEESPPAAGVGEHGHGHFEISPPPGVARHAPGHFEELPPPGAAEHAQGHFEELPAPGPAQEADEEELPDNVELF